MQSKIESAVGRFLNGHNCAQAVFTTYAPPFGIKQGDALRIATGFGGGMGRLQEVCGAVSGAFLAIGACCGMRQPALLCRELLGCDLNTEQGKAQFKARKLKDTKCVGYVREACKLLEEMLLEQLVV